MKHWWKSYTELSPFTTFVWLWVGATLFHTTDRFVVEFLGDQIALALYAILFVITPSAPALIFLLILQVLITVLRFPMIENHMLAVLMVDMLLLIKLLPAFLKSNDPNEESIWKELLPTIRVFCILLYFCAFFHKLNTGFLDPSQSCVTAFYNTTGSSTLFIPLPKVGETLGIFLISIVLLTEAAIPLFLAFRKTWFPAIVIGATFHIFASLTMRDFPMFAFALYTAFIPEPVLKKMLKEVQKQTKKITSMYSWSLVLLLSLAISGLILDNGLRDLSFRLWTICALGGLGWFAWYIYKEKLYKQVRKAAEIPHWHWILVALFIGNCTLPYLGLRTTSTLSMFSNLRTEDGVQNHLLIRTRLLPFTFQDDLVEIQETDDPILNREYVQTGHRAVWHSLKRHVRHRKESSQSIELTYTRNGRAYQLEDATKDEVLTEPESWWERILLDFRPVPKGNDTPCLW